MRVAVIGTGIEGNAGAWTLSKRYPITVYDRDIRRGGHAAKTFGAKVIGLTISREQRDFAQARIHNAGLGDKVEIRLQDCRDERDRYDRIASIEMIEAVGEQFWPKYFSQLRDRPLPGGLAGIQAITIQDSLFQTYRREVDFIQRYVFPAGCCPRRKC